MNQGIKVDRLETHDRYKEFTKKTGQQSITIADCCQDLINQRPFGDTPFYIFVHPRTDEDGVTKRLIWQPRLTKPKAQTNSMLFKAYPGTDRLKVIWQIPPREMWGQYKIGNVSEDKNVLDSIDKFEHHRELLESKEDDDLDDEKINAIYTQISIAAKNKTKQNLSS